MPRGWSLACWTFDRQDHMVLVQSWNRWRGVHSVILCLACPGLLKVIWYSHRQGQKKKKNSLPFCVMDKSFPGGLTVNLGNILVLVLGQEPSVLFPFFFVFLLSYFFNLDCKGQVLLTGEVTNARREGQLSWKCTVLNCIGPFGFLPWEILVAVQRETYSACWVFQCFYNPPNSDMDYRIFDVHTDVDACDCTRGS